MSIQADVTELMNLERELKQLSARRKLLNEKLTTTKQRIANFLKSKGQTGVKMSGIALIVEEKQKHGKKNEKEAKSAAVNVLTKHGVRHAEKVLEEILNAKRGEAVTVSKVITKKYDPEKERKRKEQQVKKDALIANPVGRDERHYNDNDNNDETDDEK